MYTPTMTISIGGTGNPANGSIQVIDVSTTQVMLAITTPWGEPAADSFLSVGDISSTVQYLTNPSREHRYIVKLLSVVPYSSATFQVLSFAYNDNLLKSPGGTNQLIVTDNLPTRQVPNAVINYNYTVTNNSTGSILLRWIFATTLTIEFASIKTPEALPPTLYGNINCWYNDWAAGTPACQERTIGPGAFYNVTGSVTLPSSGQKNFTLGVFVRVANYWGAGKDEWVVPIGFQSGWLRTITVDPCVGVTCTPDYICVGCNSYQAICNPVNPAGPCIQGSLIATNDPRCISGTLSVTSTPTGAEVYVNNELKGTTGTTPLNIALNAGTYSVKLIKAGYQEWRNDSVVISCGATTPISATLSPTPPVIYDLKIKLSSWTPSSYVIATLNRFTELLNEWILTRVSNVVINSVTYNQTNHEILVEITEMASLSLTYNNTYYTSPIYSSYTSPIYSSYLQTSPDSYPLYSYQRQDPYIQTPYLVESLILPLVMIQFILWVAPYVALLVGFIVAYIFFGERPVVPTYSSLQVKTAVMTNEALVDPVEDVTVEIAGQTLTANATNSYTVTVSNLEIGKSYPIKAYIPLSPGSEVYEALYEYAVKIQDLPMNLLTAALKIDTFTERNYRPCDLILDNGNPPPVGTILRVFRPKTMINGEVVLDPLGTTTIGVDRCAVDTIKVPAYLTDNLIKLQFISNSVDPSQPSPTLVPGSQTEIPTVEGEKNTIGVIVQTILRNNIVPDKIEIINKNTGSITKSVVPSEYTTIITGIPTGTYTISVTKSGYRYSSCSLTPCEVTFATDFLGSKTVTIIIESLVTTCALNIYVEDKYRKPPKTETYISIDGGTEQLAPNGNLQIPEITKGTHNFSVRAEGYKCSNCGDINISCVTTPEIVTLKLDQTEEILVPESITLSVNDQRGSIKVDKAATITINAAGQDTTEDVKIYNISEFPDLLVATIPMGQTETTLTVTDADTTFELQAFQRCIAGICGKSSNIISLTVGAGEEGCLVPGPFGVCLVRVGLARTLLLVGGLAIGGYVAYKMLARPKVVTSAMLEAEMARKDAEERYRAARRETEEKARR